MACHLELGQLWRCPVTWCAIWKGSGRAHLAEKHGGSTPEIKTNVAQFFPPWTVTRDVWHDALRPDVYKDPFPHRALRDGVIPRLLSSVCPWLSPD